MIEERATGRLPSPDRPRALARALLPSIILGLLLAGKATAAPGDLDETFSRDGLVTGTSLSHAPAVAVGPDGSIAVAGYPAPSGPSPASPTVARYRADGTLDPGFGAGGVATLDPQRVGAPGDLAIQPDGKIVLVGSTTDANRQIRDFAVSRLLADGSLDPSFGAAGVVSADFDDDVSLPSDVTIQPDGRIAVSGSGTGGDPDFAAAVTRLESDGELDRSFADQGTMRYRSFNEPVWTVSAQAGPGGSLFVAFGPFREAGTPVHVLKLGPDGTPEAGYGAGGVASASLGPAEVSALAVDGAGRAVVTASPCSGRVAVFCRSTVAVDFQANGDLDPGFGAGGQVAVGPTTVAAAVDPGGRVLLAGGQAGSELTGTGFALTRLLADGSSDPSFGADGLVTTDFGLKNAAGASDMATAPDGRIVVLGSVGEGYGLARYEVAEGPPDADADGVVDDRDCCPARFAKRKGGCPELAVKLRLRNKPHGRLGGRVVSAFRDCARHRRVAILRRSGSRTKRVARVRSRGTGRFLVPKRVLGEGRYRARVRRAVRPELGRCRSARSRTVRR